MPPDITKCTLLIVDDEPDLREVYAEILGSLGCRILQAANGPEALRLLQANEVHTVLSDISMPAMTGLELLQHVRSRFGQVPFVIVSAFGSKENAVEGLRLGANDFIEKPFSPAEVISVIRAALENGANLQGFEREINQAFGADANDPQKQERYRLARMPIEVSRRETERLKKAK